MASCGCARKDIGEAQSKDIIGQKFGRLTVLEEFKNHSPRKIRCLCDCGTEVVVNKTDVMSFHSQSCGCLQKEVTGENNAKDWSGYVSEYGVKIIQRFNKNKTGQWLWECECPYIKI